MSYDYRSKNPKSRDIWYPTGANPAHSGKTGRVTSPFYTKPSAPTSTIIQTGEEIVSRTYPYWRQHIPQEMRIPIDLYHDLKDNPESFMKKLNFWIKYLQANEKISNKKKIYKKNSTNYFYTTQSKFYATKYTNKRPKRILCSCTRQQRRDRSWNKQKYFGQRKRMSNWKSRKFYYV